jgi:hypothetical protein
MAHREKERLITLLAPAIDELAVAGLTTLADAVDFATLPPRSWNERRMEMSIMETPRPNDPHIMGLRLPMRSRKKVGYSDPMKNLVASASLSWMHPSQAEVSLVL